MPKQRKSDLMFWTTVVIVYFSLIYAFRFLVS